MSETRRQKLMAMQEKLANKQREQAPVSSEQEAPHETSISPTEQAEKPSTPETPKWQQLQEALTTDPKYRMLGLVAGVETFDKANLTKEEFLALQEMADEDSKTAIQFINNPDLQPIITELLRLPKKEQISSINFLHKVASGSENPTVLAEVARVLGESLQSGGMMEQEIINTDPTLKKLAEAFLQSKNGAEVHAAIGEIAKERTLQRIDSMLEAPPRSPEEKKPTPPPTPQNQHPSKSSGLFRRIFGGK